MAPHEHISTCILHHFSTPRKLSGSSLSPDSFYVNMADEWRAISGCVWPPPPPKPTPWGTLRAVVNSQRPEGALSVIRAAPGPPTPSRPYPPRHSACCIPTSARGAKAPSALSVVTSSSIVLTILFLQKTKKTKTKANHEDEDHEVLVDA